MKLRTGWLVSWLLVLSANGLALAQSPDPAARGPRAVTREEYNFGDTVFPSEPFPGPVEVLASVHYPTELAGGPFPLIVLMHGRHATCFSGNTAFLEWPCARTRSPIPSYQGYDYLSEVLASHGYIVVSVSANGVNARDNLAFDLGASARARLIQFHLNLWNDWNTTGGEPFGARFIGKVDLARVGTMGHSRGGEGVARHYLLNQQLGAPYTVRAVLPLAPVNFSRLALNNVPVEVIVPYCDGDVNDLQGIHFFDDTRYNLRGDRGPKHSIAVLGANHNYFNTVWTPQIFTPGSSDDWTFSGPNTDPHCGTVAGNQRLSPAQQRAVGLVYMAGFLRAYVGDETQFFPLLTGAAPPPASALTTNLHVSYHAPDAPSLRRDVNRLTESLNLTTNTLGGGVSQRGSVLYFMCGGAAPQSLHCLRFGNTARQPHTTPSVFSAQRGLNQLWLSWVDNTAVYTNELPEAARNVRGFEALQFRVGVNGELPLNAENQNQDFSVALVDGAGQTASVKVSDHSRALYFPPGLFNVVPKILLNTVRIPMTAFTGVNLSDIRSIQFRFDQRAMGALLVSDLAFSNAPPPPAASDQ
ncbi:MAG: alpha/beta hydrolase family protein [Blastocatellia bacterium]